MCIFMQLYMLEVAVHRFFMPSCCCGFWQLHQCREQLRKHRQQREQRQGLYFISRPMGLTTHYFQCGFVFKVDGVDHALFWVGFCFQSRCDWRRTFLGHALFASTGNLPFFWILIWNRIRNLIKHYFRWDFVFKVDGIDHALFWVGFCFQSRCDWPRTFLGHALFVSTGNLPFFWIFIWNRIRNFIKHYFRWDFVFKVDGIDHALFWVGFCFQSRCDWPRTFLGHALFASTGNLPFVWILIWNRIRNFIKQQRWFGTGTCSSCGNIASNQQNDDRERCCSTTRHSNGLISLLLSMLCQQVWEFFLGKTWFILKKMSQISQLGISGTFTFFPSSWRSISPFLRHLGIHNHSHRYRPSGACSALLLSFHQMLLWLCTVFHWSMFHWSMFAFFRLSEYARE